MTTETYLWKRSELAQALNIHGETLDRWRRTGRIRTVQLPGGERRYLLDGELAQAAVQARSAVRKSDR